jgi:hypothetical protein
LNDPKGVLEARLGWIRAQANATPSPVLAGEIEQDIENPLVRGDSELMLGCLLAKATLDQQVNEASARDVWEKILELAKGLKDERWQARAEAELGFIAFWDGDTDAQSLKGNGLLCVSEPLWRPIGEEKADALRKAKLDLLVELGDQASPVFWAGFVMVGDGAGIAIIARKRPPGLLQQHGW